MSAEILRRAASLMRERAEASEAMLRSPWHVGSWGDHGGGSRDGYVIGYDTTNPLAGLVATCADYVPLDAADHIASWHPAVAHAVATMLEDAAWRYEGDQRAYDDELARGKYPMWIPLVNKAALAVARAYLGEDQP